ncbi:MAG: TonB-dependent receptor [Opitutus sp.]|nr:TonB-dependent receptor [Opitutus sp.]
MKFVRSVSPLAFLFFSTVAPVFAAQSPSAGQDVVDLSPFVVRAQGDDGYAARQTVSATRTATDLSTLPVSISVLTEQFLNDLGAVDIQEALAYQNVIGAAEDYFTANLSTSFKVRGFNAAVLRNGFPAAGGTTPVARSAVDRIELVQGPASLLYGTMDPGGIVNVVSKRPNTRRATTVTTSVGRFEDYAGSFDTTGALTKDARFSYRLIGSANKSKAIEVATANQRKELVFMLEGKLTADTAFNVEFNNVSNFVAASPSPPYIRTLVAAAANFGRGAIVDILVPDDPSFNYRGPGNYGMGRQFYFGAEIRHQLTQNWNLRLAYAGLRDNQGRISRNGGGDITALNSVMRDTYADSTSHTDSAQLDATTRRKFALGEWRLLLGASGSQGTLDSARYDSTVTFLFTISRPTTWPQPWPRPTPALNTFTAPLNLDSAKFNSAAGYLTNQVSLFDERLHLLGGARRERATATARDGINRSAISVTTEQTIGQIGGLLRVTKTVGVYAGFSQSFLPQNLLLKDPKPTDPVTGAILPGSTNATHPAVPVTGKGWDIGLKASFLNGTLSLTGAYFQIERDKIVQTRTVTANGLAVDAFNEQSGLERSKGLEAGLVGDLFERAVSVEMKYNHAIDGKLISNPSNRAFEGKELRQNSDDQLSYFVRYSRRDGALKGAFVGAGGRYLTSFLAFNPTQPQVAVIDGYHMMDAVVGYRWKLGRISYSAQVNVSNLQDLHVILNRQIDSPPRTWRATVRLTF